MDSERPTPAEVTATVVANAVRSGTALCIPGALDRRQRPAAHQTSGAPEGTPAAAVDLRTASGLERREYERAGGGAPGERGTTRRESVIERLCRLLRWRRPNPQFSPAPPVQK